jgi:hypothetical protein
MVFRDIVSPQDASRVPCVPSVRRERTVLVGSIGGELVAGLSRRSRLVAAADHTTSRDGSRS